ncbi:MAG: hypothetical protein HKM95_05310 [Inquilinus sp.]|nr:hypothetical protein [Inquilinus sp.]
MEVDQDLLDRIAADPDRVELVSLVCRANPPVSDADLARAGLTVTERQVLADISAIFGEIRLGDVKNLSTVAGVESVSSAPDVEIF